MLCSFIVIVPCRRSDAMPRPRLTSAEYNYHDISSGLRFEHARNDILNNRAVILHGGRNQRVTIGNEKVAKKYRSRGIGRVHLQLHHILFKGIRTSLPATKRAPQTLSP